MNDNRPVMELWFGDERGYNATKLQQDIGNQLLWFGDERGYNATISACVNPSKSCGLVMKEDITQPHLVLVVAFIVVVW